MSSKSFLAFHTKRVPCFDASGTHLGELVVRLDIDAYNVLCDLQAQAAKLLPHAWRDSEDTTLCFTMQDERTCLTPSGFAYKQKLTQDEAKHAWRFLAWAERVDVAWDENDEYANQVLKEYIKDENDEYANQVLKEYIKDENDEYANQVLKDYIKVATLTLKL
jgi:hypothetical protein